MMKKDAYCTWASELGVGTPGFNVGVSGTVSVDTILDAVKPSKK